MSIVLQGSTSGSITLQEPAVAGSNTINLPAATGTAVLTGVSGNVDINAAGSNNVTLSTNSTERMRIDSSGNVGIGTSSPSSYLTGVFTVASSGDNYLNIVSGNANAAGCMFQDTTGTSIVGGTRYTHSDNKIGLWANGSEQFAATSAGLFQFNSGYGSVATAYGCRAWVNFNGEGTVSIRASGNVSSITDNGMGNYTINFTNAMPDTNYAVVGTSFGGNPVTGQNYGLFGLRDSNTANTKNTSSVQVTQGFVSGTGSQGALRDHPEIYLAIFR